MPFIGRDIANSAVFLYETEADAAKGVRWGGSGLLLGEPSLVNPGLTHIYVATNDHVGQSCRVAKLTRPDGSTAILPITSDWIQHPKGDDVGVFHLGLIDDEAIQYFGISMWVLSQEALLEHVAPGDDCFMVGRFVRPDREQLSRPVVRFGNIAMTPPEAIKQRDRLDYEQESFLVDMRSLSGFSGSAVVLYYETVGTRGPVGVPEDDPTFSKRATQMDWSGVIGNAWLLGIDWGHLPVHAEVRDLSGNKLDEPYKIQVNSGMAAVVPAWKLLDIFALEEEILTPRRELDEKIKKHREAPTELAAVTDASTADESLTEPTFQRLLRRVTRQRSEYGREG